MAKKFIYAIALLFVLCSSTALRAATSINVEVIDAEKNWITIEGARVNVSNSGVTVGEGVTDSEGQCTVNFDEDITTQLKITVSAAGYQTATQNFTPSIWSNTCSVELSKEQSSTVDMITVSGYVEDKTAVENDDYDTGIADAEVIIKSGAIQIGKYTTEWDGYYEIEVHSPVETPYTITVKAKDYLDATEEMTFDLSKDTYRKDVLMQKDPNRKLVSTVSGTVKNFDNSKQVIGGASVKLYSITDDTLLSAVVTDDSGNFTITVEGVEYNGKYILKVSKEGYNPAEKEFTFTSGSAYNQSIMLRKESCAVKGKVIDADTEEVIEHALVWLRIDGADKQFKYTTSYSGFTFDLESVEEGSYSLKVSADDYITKEVEIEHPAMGKDVEVTVKLQKALVVAGVVRAYDEYVSGAKVTLSKDGTVISYTNTDEAGDFKMLFDDPEDMPADGEYTLSASHEGYLPAEATITVENGQCAATNLYLKLERTIISGYVTDVNHSYIAGAKVTLTQNDVEVASAVTDESGDYTITLTEVNGDPYKLTAVSADAKLKSTEESLLLEIGDDYTFNLVLLKDSSVETFETSYAGNSVTSDAGILKVHSASEAQIAVYDSTGILIAAYSGSGCNTFHVVPGVYIVAIGSDRTKITVR